MVQKASPVYFFTALKNVTLAPINYPESTIYYAQGRRLGEAQLARPPAHLFKDTQILNVSFRLLI